MRLRAFTVSGYKSLVETTVSDMKDVNVLVGRNSAGKSAILQALRQIPRGWPATLSFHPHHQTHDKPIDEAGIEVEVSFSDDELKAAFRGVKGRTGAHLLPIMLQEKWIQSWTFKWEHTGVTAHVTGEVYHKTYRTMKPKRVQIGWPDQHTRIEALLSDNGDEPSFESHFTDEKAEANRATIDGNTVLSRLLPLIVEAFPQISAHRYSQPRTPLQDGRLILPDGSNLIRALFEVQLNQHDVYRKISNFVQEVLPDAGIPLVRVSEDQLEIALQDTKGRRVHLHETGGGVEQVLTIATMLCTLPKGVLMIEEPENFLHVGAQHRLLRRLPEFNDRFQFLISTHSHSFLNSAIGAQVYTIRKDSDGFTKAIPLRGDLASQVSAEIGLRPSLLALSDIALFVEGTSDIGPIEHFLSVVGEKSDFKHIREVRIACIPLGGHQIINSKFDVRLLRELHPNPVVVIDGEVGDERVEHQAFAAKCKGEEIPCTMLARFATESYFTESAFRAQYGASVPAPMTLDMNQSMKSQGATWFSKRHTTRIARHMSADDVLATDLRDLFEILEAIAARIVAQ